MYREVAIYAKNLGADTDYQVPMKKYTTFKCGGIAPLVIIPNSIVCLMEVIDFCRKYSVEPIILGNGSNVLVKDSGVSGVIIKIGKDISKTQLLDETTIYCEAGTSLKSLCKFAYDNSLSGLEFAYGIPGTVGGAVYMNAGAYGGEMKDVLYSCSHIDKEGNIGEFIQDELNLRYRGSAYADNGYTIISATLKLKKADKEEIKAAMEENLERRKEKQPLEYPSAGSTFKRPEGHFAGTLIENSGLKGFSIGGAQVSEKHAGFIINKRKATATDVITLIRKVQEKVYADSGVRLEPEVKIIGK